MKAAQVSASLSRRAGGIFEIELALSQHLQRLSVESEAIGLDDDKWGDDRSKWSPVPASAHSSLGPKFFGFSPGLADQLDATQADLGHLHSLWMYPGVALERWARKTRRPYVVTPNGMLEPWALKNSAWKKKIALFFYERRVLASAACLQANTMKEYHDIRNLGVRGPIAIIPNGIDLPDVTDNGPPTTDHRQRTTDNGPKTLLFLGRLHPKKGLANALRAWKDAGDRRPEIGGWDAWQFVIAGWDQGGHEAELKSLATELGIRWADVRDQLAGSPDLSFQLSKFQLLFVGPAFGAAKDQLLRRANAFILPSFSEGLPMAVLEAWAYGLPVLMTDHCNLPEGFQQDAAIRIGTDPGSIADGMRQLFSLPATDNGSPTTSLISLGRNGRALVERQFTWPMVAGQMKELYEWVLGGGDRPGFVELR